MEIICEWRKTSNKEWGRDLYVLISLHPRFKPGQRFKMGDFLTLAIEDVNVVVLPLGEKG